MRRARLVQALLNTWLDKNDQLSLGINNMSEKKGGRSKKDELVEIAGELFYSQGYGATGIKQIIETAGIAKGTFYSHFASKEAIGVAWLRSRNEQWNRLMGETTAKAKSPRARILVLFDLLEDWMKVNNHRGCAFLNSLAEIPQSNNGMREIIREHKEGIHDHIVKLARDHYPDKSKNYSDHKAKVIFLLFEAALVEGQNVQDLWPVEIARKEVKAILAQ